MSAREELTQWLTSSLVDEGRANKLISAFAAEILGAEERGVETGQVASDLATLVESVEVSEEEKLALRKALGIVWEIHDRASSSE